MNNTGADQPAHPRSLISAFVIRFLESIISKLATSEISIFYLVSVGEETGLNLAKSETQKTGFLAVRPNLYTLLEIIKGTQRRYIVGYNGQKFSFTVTLVCLRKM